MTSKFLLGLIYYAFWTLCYNALEYLASSAANYTGFVIGTDSWNEADL